MRGAMTARPVAETVDVGGRARTKGEGARRYWEQVGAGTREDGERRRKRRGREATTTTTAPIHHEGAVAAFATVPGLGWVWVGLGWVGLGWVGVGLGTLDPVGYAHPDFAQVAAHSGTWSDYNAASAALNLPNAIAGIGTGYGQSPQGFATVFANVNQDHGSIEGRNFLSQLFSRGS